MAKFDSQYPVQLTPEDGDKFLITSAQDGQIMALTFGTLKSTIQYYLNIIDSTLSLTSEHPVQNKIITQALEDMYAKVLQQISQAVQPSSPREVINCIAVDYCVYSRSSVESPENDKTYYSINDNAVYVWNDSSFSKIADVVKIAGNGVIMLQDASVDETHYYRFIGFADRGGYITAETGTPDEAIIYAANKYNIDGTTNSKIYRYNDTTGLYEDVAPEGGGYNEDNTIYVNNLTTDLAAYTSQGIYNVVHTLRNGNSTCYTFTITVHSLRLPGEMVNGRLRWTTVNVYTQTLLNENGYQVRQKQEGGNWGDWDIHNYAYSTDIDYVEKLAKKALKIAKGAM